MQVDTSMQSMFGASYSDYSSDLSDIFHTELFALTNNNSSSGESSSSAGSSSSRESTPHVQTPPQHAPLAAFPDDHHTSEFFNFLTDEESKPNVMDPMSILAGAPYDFFGGLEDVNMGGMAMMGGSINPQLVGSPNTPVLSDFASSSSSSSSSGSSPHSTSSDEPPSPEEPEIAPVKVGGHGKARKGTVQSGGITKKSSAPAPNKENNSHAAFMPSTTFRPRSQKEADSDAEDDDNHDDLPASWRPPPEVFAKMTAKEKRQLRNKISARNFRVRRKEYISTLEDNIAERDRLLSAIRSELGSSQSENAALRQEIAALKRTLLDGRGAGVNLPPPAPLPAYSYSAGSFSPPASLSPSSSSPTSTTATSFLAAAGGPSPLLSSTAAPASPLLGGPNMGKDVGADTSRFWGGARGGAGGYTSVHTARIPELLGAQPFAASPFAGELYSASNSSSSHSNASAPQENLNPLLNGTTNTNNGSGGRVVEVLRSGMLGSGGDAFGDANPFTVRSLDAYRMHLWGRMAAQYRYNKEHPAPAPNANGLTSAYANIGAGNKAAQQQQHLSGLASGLRPKYFASPLFPASGPTTLSAVLAGKGSFGSSSSAAWRPRADKEKTTTADASREREREKERERQEAMYAAMAGQTLVRRLGGAFWEAFSGASSASASGSGHGKMDAEKVRKVLEGRAVLRVVDVEVPVPAAAAAAAAPAATPSKATAPAKAHQCPTSGSLGLLEEKMRGLGLGKK